MYEHILISTDGSEVAQKGVDHGLELAKALQAKVSVIMATDTRMLYIEQGTAWAYQEMADMQKAAAEKVLEGVRELARGMNIEADTICVENAMPAEAIVEAAQSRKCGLIVMSSHGRSGVRRFILGSVASRVLALSEIPVLVVR